MTDVKENENVEAQPEEGKTEFVMLKVNPEGKRINKLENGDFQYFCPKGLEIDGKDLSGFSLYIKEDRMKDPVISEKSPDWAVKEFDKGIKHVYFPKQNKEGKAWTLTLSGKNEQTGEYDKIQVEAKAFVPAVIAQQKANRAWAIENAKEKGEKAKSAPTKDNIAKSIKADVAKKDAPAKEQTI